LPSGDLREYRATLPSRGGVLLPLDVRSVRGGVWLHGAVRHVALLAHGVTGWLAGRDIRLVPGRNVTWRPPLAVDLFDQWFSLVQERLDIVARSWVVQLPTDRRRRRFNLLLLDARRVPIAFVKVTANPPNPMSIGALSRFNDEPPTSFWVPRLALDGRLEHLSYVVTSAMPNKSHRPAILLPDVRHRVVKEIQARLADLATPPSVVVHGDFGPWNVRQLRDGRLAIVDWEETAAGVVAADELWHSVCLQRHRQPLGKTLTRVRAELAHHSSEDVVVAARFWVDRLGRPQPAEVDESISMPNRHRIASARTREVLEALSGSS
jgi:hypothetical protein